MRALGVALCLAVLAGCASAQPASIPGEPEVTVRLTVAEINYIGAVLRERPYKEVAELLMKMQAQASQPAQPKPKTERK